MDKNTELHILNILRQGTITWSARNNTLNRNRRKRVLGTFKNGAEKFIWERQCDGCGEWIALKDKELEVDHIEAVGPFKGDWNLHISRLYCDESNLQALCFICHDRKTQKDVASMRFDRKRNFIEEPPESDGSELL